MRVAKDGYWGLKDSSIAVDVGASMPRSAAKLRAQWLEKGVLAKRGEEIIFTEDTWFNSPSGAASLTVGYAINGLKAWKDEDGGSLGGNS